jgi:hypothetical protein
MAPVLCFTPSGETRTMRKLFKVVLATFTFLLFLYSATIAMSFMYGLDSALIGFCGPFNRRATIVCNSKLRGRLTPFPFRQSRDT